MVYVDLYQRETFYWSLKNKKTERKSVWLWGWEESLMGANKLLFLKDLGNAVLCTFSLENKSRGYQYKLYDLNPYK